jgi:hypothetical protein
VIEAGVRRRDDLGDVAFRLVDRRRSPVLTSVMPRRNIAIPRASRELFSRAVLFRGAPFQKIS